jgi:hypothetical protein
MDIKSSIRSCWHARSHTYDGFPVPLSEEYEKFALKTALLNFLGVP